MGRRLPSETAAATNLPHQVTTFVGRERELAELSELLGRTRMLTLTGPGGCGKTRLALELAGGRTKGLIATRPSGPLPTIGAHGTEEAEHAAMVTSMRALQRSGTPWREMAVLVRLNAQLPPIEDALRRATWLARESLREARTAIDERRPTAEQRRAWQEAARRYVASAATRRSSGARSRNGAS